MPLVSRSFAVVVLWLVIAPRPISAAPCAGVVAAENLQAAEVGVAILDEGGSAVDAAIATSLAACVVHGTSCGIGGGGFMVVYDARSGKADALDYREVAPAATRESFYMKDGKYDPGLSRRGAHAVGVPGEIAGLAAAHAQFGRLPWKRLVMPAATLAREGFSVTEHMAHQLAARREDLAADPELSALLSAEGAAPRAGETLRLPNLANTLDAIARKGPAAFYQGRIAGSIADTVQAAGGVLSRKDLSDYRPLWRKPLSTRYRNATVYTMPPPSAGGTALILALDTLSEIDLTKVAPSSPARWHLFAEILQHAFADRAVASGDPAFDTPLPRANGKQLRTRVDRQKTHPPSFYGSVPRARAVVVPPDDAGTAHISVIAGDGSAAAATTTINTAFGALLGARGSGVILNNELDDFSFPAPNLWGVAPSSTNRIAPGKRPASSMTPTLAVRDGRAVVAVGASGGPLIISATLQVLTNVLDFDMSPEAAVAAPRVHHQWRPSVLLVEASIDEKSRDSLVAMGHEIREIPKVAAVSLATSFSRKSPSGAGDPRKGGAARTSQPSKSEHLECHDGSGH